MNWFDAIQSLIDGVERQEFSLSSKLMRLETSVPAMNLIAWLASQKNSVQLYWSARDTRFAIAGIGVAHQVQGGNLEEPQFADFVSSLFLEQPSLCYLGGVRFNQHFDSNTQWRGFHGFRFILPLIEMRQQGDDFVLACHLNALQESSFEIEKQKIRKILKEIKAVPYPIHLADFSPVEVISSRCFPEQEQWISNVEAVLSCIERKQLDKVVLAQQMTKVCASLIDGFSLIGFLKQQVQLAYHFYMQFEQGCAFLGASPERLYARVKRRIETEAQAGTRKRGIDSENDERLAVELRGSEKDRLEHAYVLNEIEGILQTLCVDYGIVHHREIVKFSHVQHLRSRLSGILRETIDDAHILKMLHPTSAVCGLPRHLASQKIQELELFDRGYYAGAVGYLSADSSEFAVGIRSALVNENRLDAYAGAGIVKGSKAQEEWQEIQNKMNLFSRICHDPGSTST